MLSSIGDRNPDPLVVGPGGSGKAESPVCADRSRDSNNGPPHK
jgi:hypothetical protein